VESKHPVSDTFPLLTVFNLYFLLAADDVAKLLKDTGVQTNKEDLDALIKAVGGKKLHDLVRDGSKRLASVPSGGAVAAAPAKAAPANAPAAAAKKEEKPKEEEADVDMGGLFGDDY
jgi:large subunit ribosomal protein LP2